MKSCPTCNRTYPDDTLAFCLMDGAVLSAPYEPERKQVDPGAGGSTAPRTEVMAPVHSQQVTDAQSAVAEVQATNADQSEPDSNAWLSPLLVVVLVLTVLFLIIALNR